MNSRTRRDAVTITSGNQIIHLAPGQNGLVTSATRLPFESVHPAQSFAYRNIKESQLGNGLKAYMGEFSVQAAISYVKPLKALAGSSHPQARRLIGHLLKTAAILAHTNKGGIYQRMQKPSIAAWAR